MAGVGFGFATGGEHAEAGPLVVSLEACSHGKSHRRNRDDERVELAVRLENTSGRPLFLRLGSIAGGATHATALAAAGLQSEVTCDDGHDYWMPAKVLEPRPVPGSIPMAQREQALYLPPQQGARIGLAGLALGSAISFGGLSGDDAEVLLPLPASSDSTGGSTRCRVQFALRSDAGLDVGGTAATRKPTSSLHSACAWVGPFAPPHGVPDEKLCWHGEVVSKPLTLRLCPVAASARTIVKAGPAAAAPTAMTAPKPTPMPRAPCWPRPGNTFGRSIGKDRAGDVAFGRNLSKGPATDEARPMRKKTLGVASRTARSEQRSIANETTAALLDGAAEDIADADTSSASTRNEGKQQPLPPRRPAPAGIQGKKGQTLPSLSARSHGSSQSACYPRALADVSSDPFDDPMLLELAEVVSSMRTANSTVVFCTKRLKTRKGQHFVNALRVRGHRILPAPDVRVFSTWAMAPRAFGQVEDLIMVADWQELYCCYDILREG